MIQKWIKKYKSIDAPAKASIWYIICRFLQGGISVLTVPLFTRLLSTTEYGQVSVFSSWTDVLSIIITLNLSYGIFSKGLLTYKERKDSYLAEMQGLSISYGAFASVLLIAVYFAGFNNIINVPFYVYFLMIVVNLLSPSLNFWSVRQRFEFKYKKYVIVTTFLFITTPIISLIIVYYSTNRGIARIVSSLIVPGIVYMVFLIYNFVKGKAFFNRRIWRDSLKFNLPLAPHYLSQIVLNSSDRIMISRLINNSSAGLYSIAYSVAAILTLINTSINASLNPWVFQSLEEKKYDDIRKTTSRILLLVGSITLILIIAAPELLCIFASQEYFEARWAIPPIALGILYSFVSGYFGNIEFYYLKNKMVLIASTTSAIANIVLNYIFIKVFGYIACAYTTMFCYLLFCFIHYYYIKKVTKEELKGKTLFDIKLIFVIIGVITIIGINIMWLYDYAIIRWIIVSFAFAILLIMYRNEKLKLITK